MFSGTDASSPELSLCSPYGPWTQGRSPTEELGLALLEDWAHGEGHALPRARHGPRRRRRRVQAITDALIDPSVYLDRRSVRAARRGFFELSPFPKVAFVVGNRAIVEARFCEALHHYAAVFDSLDAAAAATSAASRLWSPDERAQVERVVVGEEIKGVLLRDGAHRRERHDRLRQWARAWRWPGSPACRSATPPSGRGTTW
uniref:Uncharacterized protein n=1 Tax=Oryza barthii TaxID=65489 RepID=A0A0D3HI20_9ORYZ